MLVRIIFLQELNFRVGVLCQLTGSAEDALDWTIDALHTLRTSV